MAYDVILHRDFEYDMAELQRVAPDEFDSLYVFLKEWVWDDGGLNSLTIEQKKPIGEPASVWFRPLDIDSIKGLKREGIQIYRIKIMGGDAELSDRGCFLNYRVFYAFDDTEETIHFLGALNKGDIDLDATSDSNRRRLINAYKALNLPIIMIH